MTSLDAADGDRRPGNDDGHGALGRHHSVPDQHFQLPVVAVVVRREAPKARR
jgi:hypothetical protein